MFFILVSQTPGKGLLQGAGRSPVRLLLPQSNLINILSDGLMTLYPQGSWAGPVVSHQSEGRCDAGRTFIHLSVSLFVCIAVATLIAIEMYSGDSKRDDLRPHRQNKWDDVYMNYTVVFQCTQDSFTGVPGLLTQFKWSLENASGRWGRPKDLCRPSKAFTVIQWSLKAK